MRGLLLFRSSKSHALMTARFGKRALQLTRTPFFNVQPSTFDSAKVGEPFPAIESEKE